MALQHAASDERLGADPNMTSSLGFNADAAATPSWTISCLVVGEEIPFPINIQPDAFVAELKEVINAAKKLVPNGMDHYLDLYLVNIPNDDKLVENVKQILTAEPPLASLRVTYRLSHYYSTAPPQRTIHILVQPPQRGSTPWY
jgi:hypothetical protein